MDYRMERDDVSTCAPDNIPPTTLDAHGRVGAIDGRIAKHNVPNPPARFRSDTHSMTFKEVVGLGEHILCADGHKPTTPITPAANTNAHAMPCHAMIRIYLCACIQPGKTKIIFGR